VSLVGDKVATLFVMLACFLLLMSAPCIVFASSDNWVEVTTFTGPSGVHSTSHFTVDYIDWRIRWEVNLSDGSETASFNAYVFPETSGPSIKEIHYTIGTEQTTGIVNIYNHSGSFYIVVQTTSVDNCTLIIEQNIDSIPEFPSWTILSLFLAATLVALFCRRRVHGRLEHS
jgi:hypothetical protein